MAAVCHVSSTLLGVRFRVFEDLLVDKVECVWSDQGSCFGKRAVSLMLEAESVTRVVLGREIHLWDFGCEHIAVVSD